RYAHDVDRQVYGGGDELAAGHAVGESRCVQGSVFHQPSSFLLSSYKRFMASMGDMVSRLAARRRSSASCPAASPRLSWASSRAGAGAGAARLAPPASSWARHFFARSMTLSGTPASLATSMP